ARGAEGGRDGAPGYVGLKSGAAFRGKGFQMVPPGERLVVLTPGGGGIGAPATRDPARVEADLDAGLVTEAGAAAYKDG
ncbi:MAG: hydantoinase B/oxoprolinase family protein, partial [Pseudomonadota bacterium]|nr:hydantoinase B/oxoprolinase family protein [Pseudomonadota bacterium]